MGTSEDSLTVSIKAEYLLPYSLAIMLFGIYLDDLKTYINIKIHTRMFTAALFTITHNWR